MPQPPEIPDLLAELRWRGLIHQCTDEKALHEHLNPSSGAPAGPGAGPGALPPGGRRVYAGFDPTADSLTIGNLVPIMLLRHVQRQGHTPVVVMGGGTGLIGDPSGKSAERRFLDEDQVARNVNAQEAIFHRLLECSVDTPNPPYITNNFLWLKTLTYLEVLRDIGKRFSVNQMIQKDSVRDRLQNREQGISYTEFSYQVLQAYDFLHLFRKEGVSLQVGGSDQWGNIVAGVDEIRKVVLFVCVQMVCNRLGVQLVEGTPPGTPKITAQYEDLRKHFPVLESLVSSATLATRSRLLEWPELASDLLRLWEVIKNELSHPELGAAFGLTAPLVTKADGGKFGKTESGAVWLTAERTSPYAYYQFWLNADDRDVARFLKIFTLLTQDEIAALVAQHTSDPGARHAHRALAQAATTLLHGEAEMHKAEAAAKALFSGDVAGLDLATLNDAFASAPTTTHSRSELSAAAVAPVASAPGSEGGGGPSSGVGAPAGGGGVGKSLVDLLVETNLAKSKREAREFLQNGSIALNGAKVGPDDRLTADRLLHGSVALLRRGKKQWHVTRWE